MLFQTIINTTSGEPGELGTPIVDTSTGIVTATITKGGVLEEGDSTTLQLSTQAAKTVTPSTSAQTAVDAGKYTTGAVTVAAVSTQTKTATPSTSAQDITPDSGKFLSKVTVNAMPTATQATPSITVSSAGLITASATQTAGYVAAGTKSATKQLTAQAAKTVTPSSSSQTAVAAGVYTTGAITVAAIPSTYKRMATGTVTGSSTSEMTSEYHTIKVTGLNFKPSHVMLVNNAHDTSACLGIYDTLGIYDSGVKTLTRTLSNTGFTLTVTTNMIGDGGFDSTYRYIAWA